MEQKLLRIELLGQVFEWDLPQDTLAIITISRVDKASRVSQRLGRVLIALPEDDDLVWAIRTHGRIEEMWKGG